jgi:DNA primase
VRSLDLSKVDVLDMLDAYGVEHQGISSTGEIALCCPFHHERNPSCHINSETTLWNCKGCHAKGNAVHFVKLIENISYQYAEVLLKQRYDAAFREPVNGITNELEEFLKPVDLFATNTEHQRILPEALTEKFWPMSEEGFRYLRERGFSNDIIRELNLGWDDFGRRIAFPIRDPFGRLLGFTGRAIDPWVKAKYRLLGDGPGWQTYGFPMHDKRRAFYLAECLPQKQLIVVEGELNAAALRQMGYQAVALCGSSPSKSHALTLRQLSDRVVLLFDTDEAGLSATREFNAMLEPFMDVLICPDHPGDAADALINKNGMTQDIVHELIDQAQPLYLIELDY